MLQSTFKRLFNHDPATRAAKRYSRKLTAGEIVLARSVFGDSLSLDDIQLKTAWWVLKNYAVSPNGHIYFHPADWIEDFSEASLSKQSWLIHELTHVWQLQRGLKVVRGAIINRRYDYVLEVGKSFFKYGIEQQARMVQDYFIRRQRGQDCQDLEACIPFLAGQSVNNTQHSDNSFNV
ncbi:type IV secretion protein Rhs [Psychrobacter sp. DAB_AL32B]|uniref:type IV secretion protein Rhs n=1 Tax=Psychrobacter sp. DAB_AL32B TaxID=1028414 RepID=UPI000B7C57DF|nr:type IV secretion protein Rhs [Psychrobacter sp. DAB_AL32B]OXL19604.1 type IV secretion protein Rhs [Psychrobacter sp. DAB_AL32B]